MKKELGNKFGNSAMILGFDLQLLDTLPEDWYNAEKTLWKIKIPEKYVKACIKNLCSIITLKKAEEEFEKYISLLIFTGIKARVKDIADHGEEIEQIFTLLKEKGF